MSFPLYNNNNNMLTHGIALYALPMRCGMPTVWGGGGKEGRGESDGNFQINDIISRDVFGT